uniref:C2 domain-containing protein n=1 Tax=Caenorhabditis japonica TaxID=281687 RepID=A0A8R1HRV5_CAEJA
MTTTTTQLFTTLSALILVSAKPFWLAADINTIEWQEGCLTTVLCSHPRFQLLKDLLPVSERASISWPVTDQFLEHTVAPFITYWPSGRIEDVSLSASVVGVDTTYGFPRTCDQTPAVRIFPTDIYELAAESEEPAENKTIHLKAKCFEATITVTKYTERCPWCPDPKEFYISSLSNDIQQHINLEQSALESGIHSFVGMFYNSSTSESLQVGICLLAALAFFSSLAFSIMLVIYLKTKKTAHRNSVSVNVQPRLIPCNSRCEEYDTRYDMPWDQQRPLTYWMSKSTVTSPNSLRSEAYQTYRIPPPPNFSPPV